MATSNTSHVHRLVQDENAKTILLNVPLEVGVENRHLKRPVSSNTASPRESSMTVISKCRHSTPSKKRVRSASVGRDKKSDMQARYWAFLFENLRRAVDDLYVTCESDDSILAAKEVILVLENYVRDFKNLVGWLKLKFDYENTPPLKRPTSLTWEVRKTSPAGKLTPTTALATQRLLMASPAKRVLNFDSEPVSKKLQTHEEDAKEVDVTPVDEKENEDPSSGLQRILKKSSNDHQDRHKKPKEDEKKPQEVSRPSFNSNNNKNNATQDSKSKTGVVKVQRSIQAQSTTNTTTTTTSATKMTAASAAKLKFTGSTKTSEARPSSGSRITLSSRSQSNTNLSTSKTSPKLNRKADDHPRTPPIKARVSLVARQSAAASNSQLKSGLARAATTANISRTRKPMTATGRPASAQQRVTKVQVQSTKSVPPFGSTSSVNSSCSTGSRSWADTVKGVMVHRSVEDVRQTPGGVNNDDDAGWETVRPRTRSRISPLASRGGKSLNNFRDAKGDKKPLLQKKDSLDSSMKVKHSPSTRFQNPSSAVSLPTLAFVKDDNIVKEDKGNQRKNDLPAKKELSKSKPKLTNVNEGSSDTNSDSHSSSVVLKSRKPLGEKEKVASSRPKKTEAPASNPSSNSSAKPQQQQTKKVAAETEDSAVVVAVVDEKSFESAIAKNEVALAIAEEEEKKLAQEIRDTETEDFSDLDQCSTGGEESERSSVIADKELPNMHKLLLEGGLSWADEVEFEEEKYELRQPGRVIQLHEKLSSPARRKEEPHETFKKHQEKQLQAKMRREKFQEAKSVKLNELKAKIGEVRAKKSMLLQEMSTLHSHKMQRAEKKRHQYLEGIKRKAHEEDAKQKEIAFINELQAQNSRIYMIAHTQTEEEKCEERLAEIAKERDRKVGEREAKEARAEEKRRKLEESRAKKREALQERIRTRDERIHEEQEQARKEREEAAREKARDREEKLSNVRMAEQDLKNELQGKIQQKQEDAAKRHKEKLEQIRAKAFELSIQRCSSDECGVPPHLEAYEPKKKCEICDVLISNEVHLQSHLRGEKHREKVTTMNNGKKLTDEELQICNLKLIVDAKANELDSKALQIRERSKAMKKKVKKIKNRLVQRAGEYEQGLTLPAKFDSPNRGKIGKSIKDIDKLFSSRGSQWANKNTITLLERAFGEITRSLEKNHPSDKVTFYAMDGFSVLSKVFDRLLTQKSSCVIPLRSILTCCKTWVAACKGSSNNIEHVIKGNYLTPIVEILVDRLDLVVSPRENDERDEPRIDAGAQGLMLVLTECFEELANLIHDKPVDQSKPNDLSVCCQDQISYIVNVGIIDRLASYLNKIQDPIENDQKVGEFILSCLKFMSSTVKVSKVLVKSPASLKSAPPADPTNILQAYKLTDLAGIVSMLYGILLHQGSPSRNNEKPAVIPEHVIEVTKAASQLLFNLKKMHLPMVQDVLGQEGISLEFRHIANYLVWYCQHHTQQKELLHLVIVLVGYFSAQNRENQSIIQSGHQPSVLQQLCNLPFPYFSQPDLKRILFPTLIALCNSNQVNQGILRDEMSYQLLEDFIASEDGKEDNLVKLVLM